ALAQAVPLSNSILPVGVVGREHGDRGVCPALAVRGEGTLVVVHDRLEIIGAVGGGSGSNVELVLIAGNDVPRVDLNPTIAIGPLVLVDLSEGMAYFMGNDEFGAPGDDVQVLRTALHADEGVVGGGVVHHDVVGLRGALHEAHLDVAGPFRRGVQPPCAI